MIEKEEYVVLHEWVRDYINEHCIVRRPEGMPGKADGDIYTWMFYLRNGLFNGKFMWAVSKMFLYKTYERLGHTEFQIAGLETGSTPLIASIALSSTLLGNEINVVSVRKEQKKYGLRNWIEGIPNEKQVMIVDDLCNSSASMRQCYDILRNENLDVLPFAFSIVNKVNKGVHSQARQSGDMYLPQNIQMVYLYDLDDFDLSNPSH